MTEQFQLTRDPDPHEVLEAHIDGMALDLHTGMPGRIESYDATKGLVSVLPLIKRRYVVDNAEGEHVEQIEEYPVIPNVPIAWPRGGGFVLTFPLAVGDPCWLMFSERSLDKYLDSDGATGVDPEDARHHHLSDAVCYPGMQTPGDPVSGASATAVSLRNAADTCHVQITPGGEVQIKASGAIRLGTDGASHALAKATETIARISALETAFGSLHGILLAAAGGVVPPVGAPYVANTSDPTSTKAFASA